MRVRDANEAVRKAFQAQVDGDAPIGGVDLENALDDLDDAIGAEQPLRDIAKHLLFIAMALWGILGCLIMS